MKDRVIYVMVRIDYKGMNSFELSEHILEKVVEGLEKYLFKMN
jgi:hypothetical protein